MNLDDILYVEVNLDRPLVSDAFAASTDFAVVLATVFKNSSDLILRLKSVIIFNQITSLEVIL